MAWPDPAPRVSTCQADLVAQGIYPWYDALVTSTFCMIDTSSFPTCEICGKLTPPQSFDGEMCAECRDGQPSKKQNDIIGLVNELLECRGVLEGHGFSSVSEFASFIENMDRHFPAIAQALLIAVEALDNVNRMSSKGMQPEIEELTDEVLSRIRFPNNK